MPIHRRIENVNFFLPPVTMKLFPAPPELQRYVWIYDIYQYGDDVTQYNATLFSDDQNFSADHLYMLIETGDTFPDTDMAQFEIVKRFDSPTNLFLCKLSWADPAWKLANMYVPPTPEPEEPTDPQDPGPL